MNQNENKSKRRSGGREARRRARTQADGANVTPYIKRKVPVYEVLGEEGLALIEKNAYTFR